MSNLHAALRYCLATSVVILAVGCSSGNSPLIESITIERSGDGPRSPIYKVTLRQDGSVTYIGSSNVARIGNYQAKVGAEEFRRLAELVDRTDFFNLEDDYPLVPDASSIEITIKGIGQPKTIHDGWGSRTPVELWGLEMAIDGVVAGLDGWTKSE
jgi:hypothetical protein